MNGVKQFSFSLPEGGCVILYWPDTITIESLDELEEGIALQLKSIRRSIEIADSRRMRDAGQE
jgi:hypothetical protein